MKRIIAVFITFLFLLTLVGCSGDWQNQDAPEPESYAFNAQYIRTGYSDDLNTPYHVVINSKKELEAYYEANKERFDLAHGNPESAIGFLDACDKYDDAYFEQQNLVLIVLAEGSGSVRHEITDVRRAYDENGASIGWAITINRIVPETTSEDLALWHLFLEVQMGKMIDSDDKVWINGNLSEHANG